MKYFKSLKNHFAVLGIDSAKKSFNQKIIITPLIYAVNSALTCAFLMHETISFRQFIESIYMSTTTFMIVIFFAIVTFKMTQIFALFGTIEEISENSE